MESGLFALLGALLAGAVNGLADSLPQRQWPPRSCCMQCGIRRGLALWWGLHGRCPACHAPPRRRPRLVVGGLALLFALLPLFVQPCPDRLINSLHVAVLVLIIVVDLEQQLILDVVVWPATAVALAGSLLVTPAENTLPLALAGALTGLAFFYAAYWLGQRLFGPGALGFGDVKLALLLGAMLGFHRILFALALGILLGGAVSLVLLLSGRITRRSTLPYGHYLAAAALIFLIWGQPLLNWYLG
jgi:leader peptidase (prepilin peptidase) / N-methyltransferase